MKHTKALYQNIIEEALKYAMNFYSIQEHELKHTPAYFKKFLNHAEKQRKNSRPFIDIYLISSNLNNTEKKLVLLAERYLHEKEGNNHVKS